MPLYEYTCRHCHGRFEVLQRIGKGAKGLACPGCGRRTLEKQFSTFSSAVTPGGQSAAVAGCGAGRFT